jgi:dTDP-4-amino-4,6-dideoxygalactose transaminase
MSSTTPSTLAIDGGTPVRETLLSFSPPVMGDEEIASVIETLRSGWLTSGPRARELEQRFAEYVQAPHAIATSSCTTALHLALIAAGVGPGDEVVTTSFTWPATTNAIIHAGAMPVFADIDPGSLNVDPRAMEAAIGPRTRALLPVHFAGAPCDMDAIEALAKAHRLAVVEDAAHAVETTVGDRKVGSIGDFSCFSLYATKSLAGGEGGMVTTASDAAASRLRLLRAQGITRDPWRRQQTRILGHYDVVLPGFKANLADLQAAVALPKIDRIDAFHGDRAALVARYDEGVSGLAGIEPIERPPLGRHAHHLYVVRIDPALAGADRDRYASALMAENIATGLHFLPVHTLSWYRDNLPASSLPVTEAAGASVLSLPLSAAHRAADVDDVLAALRKLHGAFTK